MPDLNPLIAAIQRESLTGEELVGIFQRERSLLEKRDIDGLSRLLEEKADKLAELESCRNARMAQQQELGLPTSEKGLTEALDNLESPASEACSKALKALRENLSKCSDYNNLNGIIISNSRKRNSQQMAILKGTVPGQPLYTASGTAQSTPNRNSAFQQA